MKVATDIPWVSKVQGPRYGTDDTYKRAAWWLRDCRSIADWGGCLGHLENFLEPDIEYTVVDGTWHPEWPPHWRVANLANYHMHTDGIVLRHVLEMTHDWQAVLENALRSFLYRMVVITFTPHVRETGVRKHHLTWPVYHFNHKTDLIARMEPYLVQWEAIRTKQPERVYYLEKL